MNEEINVKGKKKETNNSENNRIEAGNEKVNEKTKEKSEILIKTAKEYFSSAKDEFKKERYNSAVVLYFKSLVALVDLFVLQKTGDTPSSHTERFRITQENFSDVYDLLDKDFPFYQNSYFQIMPKELAEVVKNDAEIMAGKTEIEL
ncbi:MAG: hypothetical protein Q8N63_05110 [Nanoarchaeota archaeon]|nr:hypothetical protein [Nanoarchaeota archaeon]